MMRERDKDSRCGKRKFNLVHHNIVSSAIGHLRGEGGFYLAIRRMSRSFFFLPVFFFFVSSLAGASPSKMPKNPGVYSCVSRLKESTVAISILKPMGEDAVVKVTSDGPHVRILLQAIKEDDPNHTVRYWIEHTLSPVFVVQGGAKTGFNFYALYGNELHVFPIEAMP